MKTKKSKFIGLMGGIGLIFLFISMLYAASYRNAVTINIDDPSNRLTVANATYLNSTGFVSLSSLEQSNDTVTLSTSTNYFYTGDIFSASIKNNYSSAAKVFILLESYGLKKWLHNSCNATQCTINFVDFSSFSDDFGANATSTVFTTLPARGSLPIMAFYVDDNTTRYNDPLVLWAFAFTEGDNSTYHLIGMDVKPVLLNPNLGFY